MPRSNKRQALAWLGIISLILLGRGVIAIFSGINTGMPRSLILGGFFISLYVMSFIGLLVVWRGATTQRMWFVFIGIYGFSILINFILTDIGIPTAVGMPLLIIALAYFTIPNEQTNRVLFITTLVCAAVLFIDFLGPAGRLGEPDAQDNTLLSILIALSIYGIIVYRRFSNFNLRTKLITVTAVVATTAVFAVAFFEARLTSTAISEQVGNNLNTLANSEALAIGELLARQINILETLSLNPTIQSETNLDNEQYEGSQTEIENTIRAIEQNEWERGNRDTALGVELISNTVTADLRQFRALFPEYTNIFVANQHGAIIASTTADIDYYVGEEDWWISAYAVGFGATYIGEPRTSANQQSIVDIAVPIRLQDESGSRIIGVLYAVYSLNSLGDVLEAAQFGETGMLRIQTLNNQEISVDSNGHVQLKSVTLEEAELVRNIQTSGEPYLTSDEFGGPNLVSQSIVNTLTHEPQVDLLGWLVIVTQGEQEALQTVEDQQQANVVLGFGVVIVASLIAAGVASIIATPIVRLTETVSRVTSGDLTARTAVVSSDEFGLLSQAFNDMTDQLQNAIVNLESRVKERTQDLETISEVSRNLSTILEPDQLVAEIVEQIRSAYDYYYVQIYLLDETGQQLNLEAGTGTAGQAMRIRGHQLELGQGIVGQTALRNSPILVQDVSRYAGWLPNPLLPETKTELAVPISLGTQVLGVLDIQHHTIGRLTSNDVGVLRSIASQVTIALQNAQAYAETQTQANNAARINSINQKIQQAVTIEEVLQIAGEELHSKLGSHRATIRIGATSNGTKETT